MTFIDFIKYTLFGLLITSNLIGSFISAQLMFGDVLAKDVKRKTKVMFSMLCVVWVSGGLYFVLDKHPEYLGLTQVCK